LKALCRLWLAAGLLALGVAPRAAPRFVDAVLVEVEGATVTASDVALARALDLFGFEPSDAPIGREDVERYVDAQLMAREATRLGIEGAAEAAWDEVATRLSGRDALAAWLARVGIDLAWPRRLVEEDLRGRRFVDLRFRAFAFVAPDEVAAALGPGPHDDTARERARQRLEAEAVRREVAAWLAEARRGVRIRYALAPEAHVPSPFAMPAAPAPPGVESR
jgi:hypothetical protein